MEKEKVVKEISQFILSNKDQVSIDLILEYFTKNPEAKVENQNIPGIPNVGVCYMAPRLSNEDTLMINEVIWDLIIDRAITPGMNRDNMNLPWLRVTNERKLREWCK